MWLHIDMNSYFASVEQQANPFLRGRPVGICAYLNAYGCIIASSIEAKKLGVTTGMRVPEARRICPEIVLVENDPRKYRSTTKRIFRILADYSDTLEPYSIDEAFLRLEGTSVIKLVPANGMSCALILDPPARVCEGCAPRRPPIDIGGAMPARAHNPCAGHAIGGHYDLEQEKAKNIAKKIKDRIKNEVGVWLRCSIGIAPTRWLAKFGSDFQKPDGLTIVTKDRLESMYSRVGLTDAWGIGDRIAARLRTLGINTLNELRTYPVANLMEVMGIQGYQLWANVNGYEYQSNATNADANTTNNSVKSIGHSYCLPKRINTSQGVMAVLMKLCEKVGQRLREDGRLAWGVSCAWGYRTGGGDSAARRLSRPLWDSMEIFKNAAQLSSSGLTRGSRSNDNRGFPISARGGSASGRKSGMTNINFLAVTVTDLRPESHQLTLWNDPRQAKQNDLTRALDQINRIYGPQAITRGVQWGTENAAEDRIGFRKTVAVERAVDVIAFGG